ncbi:MAG: hypothetical protein NVSMB45_17210 [Ginsengibacter sp.]
MKISIKTFAVLLIAGSIISCNDDSSKTSSTTDSTTMKTAAADTSASSMNKDAMNAGGDQGIVNALVDANTKEIAWITAGVNKGSSKETKDHASMMLKDHETLKGKVMDLIAKKNMTTPSMPDVSNEVTINDKSSKDFDMAWTDKMIADHEKLKTTLAKFEGDAKDADLKMIITNTIPVVQKHLDMAKMMKGKM